MLSQMIYLINMEINFIFSIAILIISIIVHEISHGYVALFLGDPTAKYAGRLTLNPSPHIDIFGSIIFPLFFMLLPGSIVFGWAKPVPINPYNLKWGKWGETMVALAGPLSNLLISAIASLFIRLASISAISLSSASISLLSIIVIVNIVLAVFNLMPVTPLDGSKVFFNLLPTKFRWVREKIERNSFLFVIIFLFFIWRFIEPIIPWLFKLMTGISF